MANDRFHSPVLLSLAVREVPIALILLAEIRRVHLIPVVARQYRVELFQQRDVSSDLVVGPGCA